MSTGTGSVHRLAAAGVSRRLIRFAGRMTGNRTLVEIEALTELFPHRVARAAELATLGITSRLIRTRCEGGAWQRIAPGIVLLSSAPPSRAQLIASALRHAGPGAVLTGWDALDRHGMATPSGRFDVHVLVPHTRQVRGTAHIHVERTIRLPNPLLCNGFPIAPLPRAAVDTARRLRSKDTVRALIAEVVQRGRVSPARLREELDAGSARGVTLPRRVLNEVSDGIRSVAEAWARRLVLRAGLPPPEWNCPVRTHDGELLGIIDAWWDDVGLAWEVDSYQFHLSPAHYADTLRQGSRLTAAGVVVLHTLPERLRDEPAVVVNELRRAHQHAEVRPRPPVVSGELAGAS